jgi:16S rRNA (cytosine1402-N4)-methyltransferase
LIEASYTDLDKRAQSLEDRKFDGVLLDLGLSSLQLDDPKRGFSFRHDGPLDMRFDPEHTAETAADLINRCDERKLIEIMAAYGEERSAPKLARAIVRERQKKMIQTTADLAAIVTEHIKGRHQVKSLARVFQAFRIAVNGELDGLKNVLPQIINRLKTGGRLVVISYHSLEDRIIKWFFQAESKGCFCPPRLPVCICGRTPTVKLLTRRVLMPAEEEQRSNTRARSARFRAVERLAQ